MKKYKLTKEHEKQLKPWADKWIKNAMSTKAMDKEDKEKMTQAIIGLYKSANLEPPPINRIVFVPSPFVARFAAGFAAAIWYLRKNKKGNSDIATMNATMDATWAATGDATRAATWAVTEDATRDVTRAATWDATMDATWDATRAATEAATWDATMDATWAATGDATMDATWAATWDATMDATWAATGDATMDATWAATGDATRAATRAATEAATMDATRAATMDATRAATRDATMDATRDAKRWFNFNLKAVISLSVKIGIGKFGLNCAHNANRFYNGGNFWSGWVSFISFFRHVAKLKLDYNKWKHYEDAAVFGSVRFMHEKFCIISDRPKTLLVNERNQPHCENGPFCEWRDGSALYCLNGVRVPAWICLTPKDKFTKENILDEKNADIRREIIRKIGIEKTIELLGAKVLDKFGDYELLTIDIGDNRIRPYLKMLNPSIKQYHIEGVIPDCKTVKEAIMYRNGLKEYIEPIKLT